MSLDAECTKRSKMQHLRILPCRKSYVGTSTVSFVYMRWSPNFNLANDTYATMFQIFDLGNITAFKGKKEEIRNLLRISTLILISKTNYKCSFNAI